MQFNIKNLAKKPGEYAVNLLKWLCLALILGIISALAGVLFHYAVDTGTYIRGLYPVILYALPLAGIAIVFLYHICNMDNDRGTNRIIESVRTSEKVPLNVAPLIITATALTHLCGGSAGREGAALQIGGSLGSTVARALKLEKFNLSALIMCGMSGVFSAVFGTPVTAAIFSLEVVCVGTMPYSALLPVMISAISAKAVAGAFGVEATHFTVGNIPALDVFVAFKVFVLAVLVAILSMVFVTAMHKTGSLMNKYFSNKYVRVIIGSVLIIAFTKLLGTYDYNGAGVNIITQAVEEGTAENGAFLLKMLFTAVTLAAGFKGGEIVPTFFIGSTFGVFAASFLGLDPSFAAAIGLVALFCGVVNCPVASIVLSVEIFGAEGLVYFALAVVVSYLLSGNCSLYSAQKFDTSKLKG